jgi:hypothetical protein
MKDYYYSIKKHGEVIYDDIYKLFDSYQVNYLEIDTYEGEDYHDSLFAQYGK